MESDAITRLGQRLYVCLLCSVGVFIIGEPIFNYFFQNSSVSQSPMTLIAILTVLTGMFYILRYNFQASENMQKTLLTQSDEENDF